MKRLLILKYDYVVSERNECLWPRLNTNAQIDMATKRIIKRSRIPVALEFCFLSDPTLKLRFNSH